MRELRDGLSAEGLVASIRTTGASARPTRGARWRTGSPKSEQIERTPARRPTHGVLQQSLGVISSAVGTARSRILVGCSGWSYPHWRGRVYPRARPRLAGSSSTRRRSTSSRSTRPSTDCQRGGRWSSGFGRRRTTLSSRSRRAATSRMSSASVSSRRVFGDFVNASHLSRRLASLAQCSGSSRRTSSAMTSASPRRWTSLAPVVTHSSFVIRAGTRTTWTRCSARTASRLSSPTRGAVNSRSRRRRPRGSTCASTTARPGGNYSERQLAEWAAGLCRGRGGGYAFFNNDWEGFAVANALRLRELLDPRPGAPRIDDAGQPRR